MLELFVALILTTVVISATVPLMRSIDRSRRLTEQRRIAQTELGNLMEELASRPNESLTAEKLTAEKLRKLPLSASATESLPKARLEPVVTPDEGDPKVLKVQLVLHWDGPGGLPIEPARLTAWLGPGWVRRE